MSNVRRVYVEKKPDFAVKAKELKHEIKHYLGIETVTAQPNRWAKSQAVSRAVR